MATRKNKPENDKKASKKSSASTQEQMSKQNVKENGNEHFSKMIIDQNEYIQQQLQVFQEIFERQNQMIETQNQIFETQNDLSQDLKRSIKEILQKCTDAPREPVVDEKKENQDEKEKAYFLFRHSYHNLAQRNKSRQNVVPLNVEVGEAYKRALANIDNNKSNHKN